LNERSILLEEINPIDFFGTQNTTMKIVKTYFPKLKIVARGSQIKAYGEPIILDEFEKRMEMLVKYFHKYNHLSENAIEQLLTSSGESQKLVQAKDGRKADQSANRKSAKNGI
jgi:phosphate starvation-inducible PhoH-like protein